MSLCRYLLAEGLQVIEVDRPDRVTRRQRGKTDAIDAEVAARAVLAGRARTRPKYTEGTVEELRGGRRTRRDWSHRHATRAVHNEGESVTGHRSIIETERAVQAKLGGFQLQRDQMAAVANIHRAAAAVRQHLENSVLRPSELTWTAFVVLWVLWIWGENETWSVAEEAGISKGTLTGVARTLEARGLVARSAHPEDARRVLLSLTPEGEKLMEQLFPAFNTEEAFVVSRLTPEECLRLADSLRAVVAQLEEHGEERRQQLRNGGEPTPRRSGRRPRA
jgi:DNA-binding MarR family transcriptional regulator